MARDFLPDYGALPVGGQYRPIFKLFAGESWRMVSKDKKPVLCPTAGQAIQAAKDRVKEILNTRIRAETTPEIEEDILGIEEWRKEREAKAEEERKRVFGSESAKTIFAKGGRQVAVETRKRRARA